MKADVLIVDPCADVRTALGCGVGVLWKLAVLLAEAGYRVREVHLRAGLRAHSQIERFIIAKVPQIEPGAGS